MYGQIFFGLSGLVMICAGIVLLYQRHTWRPDPFEWFLDWRGKKKNECAPAFLCWFFIVLGSIELWATINLF